MLGRGAMGVIYQAHDPVIDRQVAIKLIRADLLEGEDHADFLARFRREAQAAGRCVHPNIVTVYDFAVYEGNPFLAMEFVDGSNLSQVLTRTGRMTPAQAVAVIGQVLSALAYAHRLGIVHRDVKPANILLLADGRVKMTDFGIARFDSSELTQRDAVIGTPSYMSPEQIRGEAVDARSDLFSTGVVLFELLSGERPFAGRSFTEIAVRLAQEDAPDIRTRLPEIAPGLAAALTRALAREPAGRFPDADTMAAALRQALADAPILSTDAATVVVAPRAAEPTGQFTAATLDTIERRLAQHVGPIARHLVQSAARQAATFDELCETLAQRIEQPEHRAHFRGAVRADQPTTTTQARGTISPDEVQRAERALTQLIGPIAGVLVRRTLNTVRSSEALWQTLATHIDRDADRQAFLAKRPG